MFMCFSGVFLRKLLIFIITVCVLAGLTGCGHIQPSPKTQIDELKADNIVKDGLTGRRSGDDDDEGTGKSADRTEVEFAALMQKKYDRFAEKWEDYGIVDVELLVELFLYSQSKIYNRGAVGPEDIKKYYNELKSLSKNIQFVDSNKNIVKKAKTALYKNGHVESYNKQKDSVLDYFLHSSIQCSSGSRIVMLISMLSQWNRFNNQYNNRADFMKYCKDNVFVYRKGHVQPGWLHRHINIDDVIVVESTENNNAELNLGTFEEMTKKRMSVRVCRADYVLMTHLAQYFNDRIRIRIWKKEAVLFENKIVHTAVQSSIGNDMFGFGYTNVPEGDLEIKSAGRVQSDNPSFLPVKEYEGEPIIKRKKKRGIISAEEFERKILRIPLSSGEKRKCLSLLSSYLRYVNENHIQHLSYLNKEVIEQMGRFGFDFSYVLNNDRRIEYVCGMFSIFGQSATKKEEKTTGNSSISWDKLYDLMAVDADDYRSSLGW